MKRLLALAPAALLLAACGDTCTSKPAAVDTLQGQCSTVAAGSAVTINLQLCPTCSDTSPSCTGEVRPGNLIELDSVVQQCQAQSGCSVTGCNISPVGCPLSQPLQDGQTYTVQYSTGNGGLASTTLTAQSGGSTSCTL